MTIKYRVSLKTTDGAHRTDVEVEDSGNDVQNNGLAIRAALRAATMNGFVPLEPVRVERVPTPTTENSND